MNKLIHDPTSHGQKVIFSSSQELAKWLSSQRNGTLFAINKHASIVYTVIMFAIVSFVSFILRVIYREDSLY